MSTQTTPQSDPAGRGSPDARRPMPESDSTLRRRKLLRLAAGGVPLLSASPVSARLAASSAFRAARNDAKLNPPMVTLKEDGWIRAKIELVEVRIKDPLGKPKDDGKGQKPPGPRNPWDGPSTGGPNTGVSTGGVSTTATSTETTLGQTDGIGATGLPQQPGITAYKFGQPPRYTQINGLMSLNPLFVEEVSKKGHVYALVLFDKNGGIHGVDPGRMLGSGLQGLHHSSWRSISPNGAAFPGYHTGV